MTKQTKQAVALLLASIVALGVGAAHAPSSQRFAGFTGFSPPNVGTTPIGGSGGGGTVTSIADSGAGDFTITNGTTAATIAAVYGASHHQKAVSGGGVANKAITDINPSTGAATVAFFVNSLSGTPSAGQYLSNLTLSNNALTATYSAPTVNDYTGTFLQWGTDGECITPANNTQCGPFSLAISGTGAAQNTTSGANTDPARPFWYRWTTGTTTTGRVSLLLSPTMRFGGGAWSFHAVYGTEQLSNSTDEYAQLFGFIDTASAAAQTDGVYFLYDRGNVMTAPNTGAGNTSNLNNWICGSANNGTRTEYVMDGTVVSDSSFTTVAKTVSAASFGPTANVYNLDIECNAGGTECDFYVNGTKSCVITTNIPTASPRATGAGFLTINSAGTGAGRNFDLDSMWITNTLTSVRSP